VINTAPITIPLLTLCSTTPDGRKPFLESFQRVLITPNVPAKTAYWLGKIAKIFAAENAEFEKVRVASIETYGAPSGDEPGQFSIPADKIKAFNAEIQSLDHPIELPMPAELKLDLPPSFTPADWLPLMSALDIFNEPL
jgi:hypothetical protein